MFKCGRNGDKRRKQCCDLWTCEAHSAIKDRLDRTVGREASACLEEPEVKF